MPSSGLYYSKTMPSGGFTIQKQCLLVYQEDKKLKVVFLAEFKTAFLLNHSVSTNSTGMYAAMQRGCKGVQWWGRKGAYESASSFHVIIAASCTKVWSLWQLKVINTALIIIAVHRSTGWWQVLFWEPALHSMVRLMQQSVRMKIVEPNGYQQIKHGH
jgi:hypothetical protein